MELDKRIIEGKKPLDCIDAENEEVQSFIGKEGYFSNHISGFIDISDLETSVLTAINPDEPDCEVYKSNCTTWEYFLPAEWVKPEEPEKKYRPYTLAEWIDHYGVGDVITYRIKDCEVVEQSMFIGFQSNEYVLIGNCRYSFKELFNNYELKAGGEWQPFGVKEK